MQTDALAKPNAADSAHLRLATCPFGAVRGIDAPFAKSRRGAASRALRACAALIDSFPIKRFVHVTPLAEDWHQIPRRLAGYLQEALQTRGGCRIVGWQSTPVS